MQNLVNTSIQDIQSSVVSDTLGVRTGEAFVHYFFYRTCTSFLSQDGQVHVSYVCRVKKAQFLEDVWKACTVCS